MANKHTSKRKFDHDQPIVFISHDARDAKLAEAVANLLNDASGGTLKSFRSSDSSNSETGVPFGVEWYTHIMGKLQNTREVIAILTPTSIGRPWILYEVGVAKGKIGHNAFGLAVGLRPQEVNNGPFSQFQNCISSDTRGIVNLVTQLISNYTNAEPRQTLVEGLVKEFVANAEAFLATIQNTTESPPRPIDEGISVARLFEEVKAMINSIQNEFSKKLSEASCSDRVLELTDKLDHQIQQMETHRIGAAQNRLEEVLKKYAEQIDLLHAMRLSGIVGIRRNRVAALEHFIRYLETETGEVVIIGSSLKGVFQSGDEKLATRLKSFVESNTKRVRILLTHPVVADFRASQERRDFTMIGKEILDTLRLLKSIELPLPNVRLYLGTPTCFAIKVARKMLINPYPYVSAAFDSPCLLLDGSLSNGPDAGYFFDAFNSSTFGAWDTNLAVPIDDFDKVINYFESKLDENAQSVKQLLDSGKLLPK